MVGWPETEPKRLLSGTILDCGPKAQRCFRLNVPKIPFAENLSYSLDKGIDYEIGVL